MNGARPGFLRAFLPTFLRGLTTAASWRKAALLFVALAAPPLLMLPARASTHTVSPLVPIVLLIYLNLLVPLTGLILGTAVISAEEAGGNLPFLFTRPAPRRAILLGRFAACLLFGWVALLSSLAVTLALAAGTHSPQGFPARSVLAVLAAFPAYLAIFTLLSGLTRWALIGGLLYAMGLEGMLGFLPGMIRKATLLYYSRSLLGTIRGPEDLFGRGTPATSPLALGVLLGVTLVALALATFVVSRREYALRNPARG